jgi:uroporphyrinogen-III synthase
VSRPRVIVTRPRAQAQAWVRALLESGVDAQALPLIDITPAPDPLPVRQAWGELPGLAFVMFVSANAVEHFFALRPAGASWPAGLRAGSTGQGTTAALRACGVPDQAIVRPAPGQTSESESLWAQINHEPWQGQCVLVVRGEEGRHWLAQQFQAAGAAVAFLVAYRRHPPQLDAAGEALLAQALAAPRGHVWLFSSSEAVGHLRALAPHANWTHSQAMATHARIAQAAGVIGFAQVAVVEPSLQAVAAWEAQGAQGGGPLESIAT